MFFFIVDDGTNVSAFFLSIYVLLFEVVCSMDFLDDFFIFCLDFFYFLFELLKLLVKVGNLFSPFVDLLGVFVFEVGKVGCGGDGGSVLAMLHSNNCSK